MLSTKSSSLWIAASPRGEQSLDFFVCFFFPYALAHKYGKMCFNWGVGGYSGLKALWIISGEKKPTSNSAVLLKKKNHPKKSNEPTVCVQGLGERALSLDLMMFNHSFKNTKEVLKAVQLSFRELIAITQIQKWFSSRGKSIILPAMS